MKQKKKFKTIILDDGLQDYKIKKIEHCMFS